MKKRNHRQNDYQTMGRKILCGKFAQRLRNNFAVGDEDNNLLLYNLITNKPITVLNSQTSNISSITALTFTQSDDQVVVGSNRGSMNVWDLNTLKISYCLKGHPVEICAFHADKINDNILISGSYDTNAKLWDLRNKNCLNTIKGHKMKVSALSISADSKFVITGGQDGIIQSWDLRLNKTLFQYDVGTPILNLDSHSNGYIAAGCMDRIARIYDINAPFKLLGSTKNDSMPISSVVFYKDDILFTAGTDILKAWNIAEDIFLTDNIETSSKGIMHMVVADKVQQLAFSSGCLSYHQCFLSEINFKGPYVYSNNSIQVENRVPPRGNSVPKQSFRDPTTQITNQKVKKIIEKRNQSLAKEIAGVYGDINDVLSNVKKVSEEFSKKKNQTLELNQMMQDQHSKFLKVMGARAKSIQTILDLWIKGNAKQVMLHLKNVDIYVASDVLTQIMKPNRGQISAEFGIIIAEKSKQMIKCKHITIIKHGLQYMLQIVSLFKDDMIKLKIFGMDKGVDLAREQRLRRYDLLIEQYMEVYQSHRLKHLMSKNDQVLLYLAQTSNLAQQLSSQLSIIFQKIFPKQQF